MEPDEEIKKKFKIFKRNDKIIMVKVWAKNWDEEGAKKFVEELSKVLEGTEGMAKILGDATEAGFGPTLEARKIYASLLKSPKIGKAAVYGLSASNRVIASFLIKASGKKDFGVFKTEEEALEWLKEN